MVSEPNGNSEIVLMVDICTYWLACRYANEVDQKSLHWTKIERAWEMKGFDWAPEGILNESAYAVAVHLLGTLNIPK